MNFGLWFWSVGKRFVLWLPEAVDIRQSQRVIAILGSCAVLLALLTHSPNTVKMVVFILGGEVATLLYAPLRRWHVAAKFAPVFSTAAVCLGIALMFVLMAEPFSSPTDAVIGFLTGFAMIAAILVADRMKQVRRESPAVGEIA